ncbi:MAG: lysophospholipid acyltransferase family protein [Candidatus Scalinduaceae bacterium]
MKFKLLRWIPLLYFKVFHRIAFYGCENIPANGPIIVAPNHITYYDPVIVAIGIRRNMEAMAWGRLFSIPIFGKIIRFLGAFPVEISKVDKSAYIKALETLNAGKALIIFPEGGRSIDGKVKKFKLGIARIASKTNASIIPVTIVGAYETWPKHKKLPHPGKISVYYHKPITIDKHKFVDIQSKHDFFDRVTNQVMDAIKSKLG